MFKGQESRAQDYVNGVQRIGLYDIWPPPTIVGSYVEPILPQDLVAPYGKVLQDMHRAGWEPVTHARCAPSSVQVERYGPRDAKTYFALFNPTAAEAQVTLTVDAKSLGLRRITKAAEFCVHAQMLRFAESSDGSCRVSLNLPGQRLAVIQVGEDSVDAPVAVRDHYVAPREAHRAEMRKPRVIGFWRFDEGKGQGVGDSDAGAFRKSPQGAPRLYGGPNPGFLGALEAADPADPQWVTDPQRGTVLRFDGQDDVVTIPNRNTGALTMGLTVEAWVCRREITPNARILACSTWDLFFAENTDQVGLRLDGYSAHAAWSKPIPRNQWVHIKATYDNKEIRVYVNGELSGSKEFVSPLSAGGRIAIGNALNAPRPFAGMIDDVRIVNQPQ